MTRGEAARWGDLHVGDVVDGRDGLAWTVRFRAPEDGSRWLSRAGDRHDLFELSCEDGRTVRAGRPLGDVVPLRSRAPDSELASSARAQLIAVFGDVTLIREGSLVSDSTDMLVGMADHPSGEAAPNTCRHAPEMISTLADKRIYCTGCFETVGDAADPIADAALAERAGLAVPVGAGYLSGVNNVEPHGPQCGCARPECVALFVGPRDHITHVSREGVDASGTRWEIPAGFDDPASCAVGVHPLGLVQWAGEVMNGCAGCGLVFPNATPLPAPAGTASIALDGYDAVNDDQLEQLVLSDPTPTVATVTVVSEPAPTDVFLDPALKHEPGDAGLIKNKRYWLPDPLTGTMTSYTRASTLSKVLSSTFLLDQWELREVAYGVAVSPDLIALAASVVRDDNPLDRADAKATLSEVVKQAKQRAKMSARANLGTALHAFTHRRARGEALAALNAPAALIPDIQAYEDGLRMHGLTEVPDLVERTVVSTSLGVAGTFDRIVHQRGTSTNPHPVPYTVLDLKTGRTLDFSLLEFAIQLGIYANADWLYDKATGTYQPFPGPDVLDRSRALVMHLPVGEGKATVWAIDVDRGFELALVAEQARVARNKAEGFGWLVQPDPETLLIHRVSKADGAELARLWEVHNPAGQWTPAVHEAAMDRQVQLSEQL